ncbi:MAG TPA: VanZ family protein [Polyangiaceae bacterium]|jgi:VanZ family protein|nr:VanZ family protein [Polyangiaceae bacterium]
MPPDPSSRDPQLAFVLDVLPASAYVVVIFYTGLIRLAKLPEVGFMPTDKLLHALAFAGLALLLVRATRVLLPRASLRRRLSFAVFLASFVGALLEVCQAFVPYRSAELLDWVADTVGALAAAVAIVLYLRLVPRRAHG